MVRTFVSNVGEDRMTVDFMIVGAQKCGTTTLYDILNAHPSICGSQPKEPHFFSLSPNWRRELSAYHRCFDFQPGKLHFEASTSYTFYPYRRLRVWQDIYDYNPQMRFIYLVRHPIDRIVSAYMHAYERGVTDLPIDEAVLQDRMYVDATRYYSQIAPFIRRFGRDRVLVVDFDDLNDRRADVVQRLAEFLGVAAEGFRAFDQVHANRSVGGRKQHYRYDRPSLAMRAVRRWFPAVWTRVTENSARSFNAKPVLGEAVAESVIEWLRLDVAALEPLLNKELNHWLEA